MGRNRDDNLKVGIEYDVDTASLNQAASSASQVSEGLDDIAASNERLAASADQAGAAVSDSVKSYRALQRRFADTKDDAREAADAVDELRQGLVEFRDEEERQLQRRGSLIGGTVGGPGRLDAGAKATRVRDIGGAGAALGGEQFERLTFIAADITDAGQALTELAPGLTSSTAGIVSLGAAGVAFGVGFVALTAILNDAAEQSRLAAEAEQRRIDALIEANQLAAGGGTTEDARQQLDELRISAEATATSLSDLEQGLREELAPLEGTVKGTVNGIFDTLNQPLEDLLDAVDRVANEGAAGAIAAQIRTLQGEAAALSAQTIQLTGEETLARLAANDALAAARAEAELMEEQQRLLATSTSDAVQATLDSNQIRMNGISAELSAISRAATEAGEFSAAAQARFNELTEEFAALDSQTDALTTTMGRLILKEEELQAAEEQRLIAAELRRVGTELAKQEALDTFEAEREGAERLSSLRERIIQESIANEEESLANAEETAKRRAAIEKKLADQIISITQKAADAARETRLDLERELADLQTSSQRDLTDIDTDARREALEIAIDDQRESEKTLRQHLRRMQKLRADSEVKEAELIQARDFRGLFNLRRQNRRQLENETTQFSDQERERQIALANERADIARHTAELRVDRLAALKQEISDAQLATARRLGDINRRRNLELARLQQSANQQLALLSQTEAAKVAIVQQGAQATKAALSGMFSAARANAFRSAFASGSRVNITDKSTNTFNTGASAKDVQSLVDSRIVRNLSRVIKK